MFKSRIMAAVCLPLNCGMVTDARRKGFICPWCIMFYMRLSIIDDQTTYTMSWPWHIWNGNGWHICGKWSWTVPSNYWTWAKIGKIITISSPTNRINSYKLLVASKQIGTTKCAVCRAETKSPRSHPQGENPITDEGSTFRGRSSIVVLAILCL